MVEERFGYEVVDQIISASTLESNGIYTAVGTYPHSEIVQLLMNLSDQVKVDPMLLLKEFGKYLFDVFLKGYPHFFSAVNNACDFLLSVDNHIHVEVLKLYPDADLPTFVTEKLSDGTMVMIYKSERKMAALAEGLMERAIAHYNEDCNIIIEYIKSDGSEVKFTIVRK